jgi:beta-lactamase regulating signal transducer with metallopeptidase domain
MMDGLMDLLRTAEGTFALHLLLKATLLLALAEGVALALRRASAASRHLVWTLAVAGLLALPLFSLLLPAWRVPLGVELAPVAESALPRAEEAPAAPVTAFQVPAVPTTMEAAEAPSPAAAPSTAPAVEPVIEAEAPFAWGTWLVGVWALGAALLLLRLLAGWWGARRLAARAEPVADPAWARLLRDLSWMLDVERPVRLLQSRDASMPMTWGTRRPVVLLPAEAEGWAPGRRRVVLLHELAHVARRDCLTQALADLACTVYWFHPLSWHAARRLRAERERACDDRVLAAGARASDYAGHLLEVARAFRPAGVLSAAAIAMARPSQLEGRLLAVLDSARSRRTPGRRALRAGVAATALLLLPLSALRAGVEGAEEAPPALFAVRAAAPVKTPAPRPTAAPDVAPAAAPAPAQERVITRQVSARPGGTLRLDLRSGGDVRIEGWDRNSVSLRAELGGRDWRDTRVEVAREGDVVRVSSLHTGDRRSTSTSHEFVIRVPSHFNLELRSGGGEVTIEAVRGSLSGRTGGGEIRLKRVSGEARLSTGGGEIDVSDSDLRGEVRTGGGEVTLRRVRGGLRGYTGGGEVNVIDSDAHAYSGSSPRSRSGSWSSGSSSGSWSRSGDNSPQARAEAMARAGERVRVRAPNGALSLSSAPAGVEISTGGGSISIGSSGRDVQVRTGGGAIAVGSTEGAVDAQTGGGAISIGRTRGGVEAVTGGGAISIGPVYGPVRATTGAGAVAVSVAGGAGERDVEITSGTGAVSVVLPADFSGEFDIETAYTENHRRRVRIISDFPLRQSEDPEWDRSRGTPRKVVRATGRVGSGTHRVRIRTVNGDVCVRRAGAGDSGCSRTEASRPRPEAAPRPRPALDEDELEIIIDEAVNEGLETAGEAVSEMDIGKLVAEITAVALREALAATASAFRDDSTRNALQTTVGREVRRALYEELREDARKQPKSKPKR